MKKEEVIALLESLDEPGVGPEHDAYYQMRHNIETTIKKLKVELAEEGK